MFEEAKEVPKSDEPFSDDEKEGLGCVYASIQRNDAEGKYVFVGQHNRLYKVDDEYQPLETDSVSEPKNLDPVEDGWPSFCDDFQDMKRLNQEEDAQLNWDL